MARMLLSRPHRGWFVLLAALLPACANSGDADGPRVGDVPIPAERLDALGQVERQAVVDLVGLGAALAQDGVDSLVAPIVRREVVASRIGALSVHVAADRRGVGEEDLRAAYERFPQWELSVRHVVRLADPSVPPQRRDQAIAVAREIADRAAAGEDFASLAVRFSEEPGAAERGGLLQPGRQGSWVDPFWEAAVRLRPGEVSDVVETEYGYHVLRLEDRRRLPFDQANLTILLREMIPEAEALSAIEAWATTEGAVLLDPPAVGIVRSAILNGDPVPDSLAVATGASGGVFSGEEAAASWARLSADQRPQLESADENGFANWLTNEAREVIWGEVAAQLGAEPPPGIEESAWTVWRQTVAHLAQTFGFARGMDPARIVSQAFDGALSGTAEARGLRLELRGLRPLLRAKYPFSASEEGAADSDQSGS